MLQQCFILFRWMILLYILMGIMIQFGNTYGIKVFQQLVDAIAIAESFNDVVTVIIIYGLLLAGTAILDYLMEYPQTRLSIGIYERLRIMSLAKVSRMDYAAYQNIGTGEMIKLIENGASAGTSIIHGFFLRIAFELLPTIVFSLLFIGLYSPKIMITIAVGYVFIFILTNVLLRMLYRIKSSLLDAQEKMSKYSVRGFMELVVFRLNKRYEKELDRLQQTAGVIVKKSTQIRMVHESFFAIFALLVNVIKVVVIIYGVRSILAGESSVGVMIALVMFIDQVYTPVAIFNVLYVDYKLNRVAYRRLEEFVNAPEDGQLDAGREMETLEGNIEFRDVTFNYGNSEVLRQVSFSVEPGSTVAIVGLSGSGKSTIVKLMLGLLKKKSGSILLDGIEIDEIKLNSLYDHVSYISQEAPIFDTTVRDNIALDRDMSDEQLYDILEKVHLKEKVLAWPDGLDSQVGERGMKLSGGERQRLAFARVIAQQRNVVILDEPVSALDNITEKNVMAEVLRMFAGKTVIVIAHRLGFVAEADKIVLVRNGEVVDEGRFEELMERSGYFRELWRVPFFLEQSSINSPEQRKLMEYVE